MPGNRGAQSRTSRPIRMDTKNSTTGRIADTGNRPINTNHATNHAGKRTSTSTICRSGPEPPKNNSTRQLSVTDENRNRIPAQHHQQQTQTTSHQQTGAAQALPPHQQPSRTNSGQNQQLAYNVLHKILTQDEWEYPIRKYGCSPGICDVAGTTTSSAGTNAKRG